jgi:hypothetical protein
MEGRAGGGEKERSVCFDGALAEGRQQEVDYAKENKSTCCGRWWDRGEGGQECRAKVEGGLGSKGERETRVMGTNEAETVTGVARRW